MCGIVGIYGHPEASNLAYLGLYALQHRGQESAGIVATDGDHLRHVREMGHVNDIFTADRLARLPGFAAIGHVRYSTAGDSTEKNAQPIAVDYAGGSVALGHNGNLVNAVELRERLEAEGAIFTTTSDTECIVHLIARSREHNLPDRIADALSQVRGAYSLVFLSEDMVIAVRDPMGFRPLVLGKVPAAGGGAPTWVVSSETCAFELIGAEFVRDIEPGEMVLIDRNGPRSLRPLGTQPAKRCVFEFVYFARPDSVIDGRSVYRARERMGRRLALEHPVEADVVIPVPDSGVAAAIGYARESGIPYDQGLMRSHYMGRTFIEPSQQIRHFGVKLKLSPVREVLKDMRVVVVDDSIVRGTTSRKIVGMIRNAGAREVHMRISSPPTIGPCRYGIDTPTREELIASHNSVVQIRDFVGADSLGYLSLPGLYDSVDGQPGREATAADVSRKGFCDACFSGNYPIAAEMPGRLRQLRLITA
ncbi:MAG TPA: amidophosphoribosyltransferase [Polyangia bacterium]|jgi:amidophosphoribosyltransferase|nr:amidophosphoribosyltransferase [Polyangia bacterium]